MITKKEILESTVRALSWKEPFGSLMLHGKVETRTRDTKYRGLVLICTTREGYTIDKLKYMCGDDNFRRIIDLAADNKLLLKNSSAIAIARIRKTLLMKPWQAEECFVEYTFPPKFCWYFTDVTPIEPIPWKGKQGWSIVSDEQKQFIKPAI